MSLCTFSVMLYQFYNFSLCLIYLHALYYGGETPSIFVFLNDLVSKRLHELPGEQLVCIVIRPGNHPSEAVTAFLILLLAGLCFVVVVVVDKPFVHLLSMHKASV